MDNLSLTAAKASTLRRKLAAELGSFPPSGPLPVPNNVIKPPQPTPPAPGFQSVRRRNSKALSGNMSSLFGGWLKNWIGRYRQR